MYLIRHKEIYRQGTEFSYQYFGLPVYSISTYNKVSDTFDNEDTELSKQIFEINKNIRAINRSLHASSPEFSSDLYKKSKYKYLLLFLTPAILVQAI
jgi:hypothetical protein